MLSNADIKRLAELKDRSGRKEQGLFFIEGKRAVVEALTGDASITEIIISIGTSPAKLSEVYSLAEKAGVKIEEVPAAKFNKISSTETSQGVLAVASVRELSAGDLLTELRPKRKATVLVLDKISDPGNLGTILRSAAWFGVDAVFIAAGSVDAYNPKVVRAAMAAICRLDVVQDASLPDVLPKLKSLGFSVVASTQDAELSYVDFEFQKRVALVFGSEATGISHDVLGICEARIGIPGSGKMESLNVGVASSIVLSELSRQRSGKRFNS